MEINEVAAGALTAAVVSGTEHSEGRSADGRIPKMFVMSRRSRPSRRTSLLFERVKKFLVSQAKLTLQASYKVKFIIKKPSRLPNKNGYLNEQN
jgi:hypothetical protein